MHGMRRTIVALVLSLAANFEVQAQPPDGLPQTTSPECVPGSLWDAVQAEAEANFENPQTSITIWRDSLIYTGLSEIASASRSPNTALFIVKDSGLYQCAYAGDVACLRRQKDWYLQLTTRRGVGLLLLHWVPDTGDFAEDKLMVGEAIELHSYLESAVDGSWSIAAHRIDALEPLTSQITMSLPEGTAANSTFGGGASSNVVHTVQTCGNGTLYILDRPLVPVNLSEASVNALEPLKDFCWTNLLSLIMDAGPEYDVLPETLIIYSPTLLQWFLSPLANTTWLIPNPEEMRMYADVFSDFALRNPHDFVSVFNSQALLHVIPGGYCPEYLDGKSMRPYVGLVHNKDEYRLNFTKTGPEELIIENYNILGEKHVTNATFLGSACYSTAYALNPQIYQWAWTHLNQVPRTTEQYLSILPKLRNPQRLFGVIPGCNGSNYVVGQDPGFANITSSAIGPAVLNNTNAANSSSDDYLSAGVIAAIAIGAAVLLSAMVAAGGLAWMLLRRRRSVERSNFEKERTLMSPDRTVPPSPFETAPAPFAAFEFRGRNDSHRVGHDGSLVPSTSLNSVGSGGPLLPAVPWHEFLVEPKDIVWSIDSYKGERELLGAGRFGRVYKALLHGMEPVAVKCIAISSTRLPGSSRSSTSMATDSIPALSGGSAATIASRVSSEDLKPPNPGVDPYSPESLVSAATRRARYAQVGQITTPQHKILQEISLLKAFRSQYVVSFVGACFQDAEVLLVTELMPGGDLWTALREERISWRRGGYEVALDVCAALTYIHSKRVVHLDIKSSNILLKHPGTLDTSLSSHLSNEAKFDEEGGFIETTRQSAESPPSGAKLSDVGLARIVPVSHEYIASTAGGVGGTWHWSAPECILGQKCTPAADIWSLGVVLWELVTGEIPVRGMMREVRVPEECCADVAALISSCWEPDPGSRPSAAAVLASLRHIGGPALSSGKLSPKSTG